MFSCAYFVMEYGSRGLGVVSFTHGNVRVDDVPIDGTG